MRPFTPTGTTVLIFLLMLISTIFFQPSSAQNQSKQGDGTLRRIRIPILMYHYISPLPADADDIRIDLTITPDLFHDHIQYLQANGYTAISLYEVTDALLNGNPLPQKPVVLTFDDGYLDHYRYVFPILKETGFKGTFFVITAYADQALPAHLSWEQIQEMADSGMHMEAHTKNHLDLRERDRDFLIYEILGSLESVGAHTGISSVMFAYPGGRYDETTLKVIAELPVEAAVTTRHGAMITTNDLLEMPRLRASGGMSVTGLAHLLNTNE